MPKRGRRCILIGAAALAVVPVQVFAIRLSNTSSEVRAIRRRTTSGPSPLRRLGLAIVAIVCGVVAYAVYSQVAEGGRIDSQVRQLQQQNAALTQSISDHQREIVDAQTVAWLEEEARKLGYVLPGEKVYEITAPGHAGPASGGVNVALPSFAIPTPTSLPTPSASPTPKPSPTPMTFSLPNSSPSPH